MAVPKILYIGRDESRWVFRGPHHFQQALAQVAAVHFHRSPGPLEEILAQAPFRPDLIMLHMQPLPAALNVQGPAETEIPVAMYIEDVHYRPAELRRFIEANRIRLVFCPYREHFGRFLAGLNARFRWLPHCVDPGIFYDDGREKDIDVLLMGQVVPQYYPFRQAAAKLLEGRPGFVRHGHPGYVDVPDDEGRFFVGERYARELNRAKLFITCGSKWRLPVAKYFEAPACGACLVAPGGPDLPSLGFVDGETFVACEPDQLETKLDLFLRDRKRREQIARRGHELVMERHTAAKRAGEFLRLIEEID